MSFTEDATAPADEAGPFDDPVQPEVVTDADETFSVDADDVSVPVLDPEPTEDEPVPSGDGDEGDSPPAATEGDSKPRSRAAPTDLQGDMKRVTDLFVMGDADLLARLDGKPLTPSRVSVEVQRLRDAEKAPSTGAVAAAFKRWEEYGFASFHDKPLAFADYTDEGRTKGLKGILSERRAERSGTPEGESAPDEAPASTEF